MFIKAYWCQRTGFRIALEAQHDLGGSIPSSGDILGHISSILLWVHRKASSQTKIADLQLTVCIDEQISGFQVAVENVGRVNVLEPAENLIDERLEVSVGKRLAGADNGGKVTFHHLYISILVMHVTPPGLFSMCACVE